MLGTYIGAFGGSERSCMKGKLTRAMTTFHCITIQIHGGSCKHMYVAFKHYALGRNAKECKNLILKI